MIGIKKKLIKQGKPVEKLKDVITLLIKEMKLSVDNKLHVLEPKDQLPKRWDIHIGG